MNDIGDVYKALAEARSVWAQAQADCWKCGWCAERCELLHADAAACCAQVNGIPDLFTAGLRLLDRIDAAMARQGLSAGGDVAAGTGGDADAEASGADAALRVLAACVAEFANTDPAYAVSRSCSMCNHCAAFCHNKLDTAAVVRQFKRLYNLAGLIPASDWKSVQVDQEWHIFSVYRAVYGIHYPEYPLLDDLEPGRADTLFFPGCSLVSYAPQLVRAVGGWLDSQGVAWALSVDCCGSPLMSHGAPERSIALRRELLRRCKAAGISKLVTVCAGCGEELAAVFGDAIQIVALPQILEAAQTEAAACTLGAATAAEPDSAAAAEPDSAAAAEPGSAAAAHIASAAGGEEQYGAQARHSGLVPESKSASLAEGAVLAEAAPIAFFDSCHDRSHSHALPLRRLFAGAEQRELAFIGRNTRCCGAGGGVSAFDPALCERRAQRLYDEADKAGAKTLLLSCPTCAYTLAAHRILTTQGDPGSSLATKHYLELLFGQPIDWDTVFAQLQGMWSGEYGAWVCEQLL
jgi:Fe-S oxidoreductase